MIDTQGKLLVAPPGMPDWRFQKTVLYVWKHDVSGAAGVIINKKCNHPTFDHVCQEGGIEKQSVDMDPPVYYGGPILTNIIGILHSKDFMMPSTNTNKNHPLGFTLDRRMLELIAQGKGPKQKLVTLGMSNWDAGQLENEIDGMPPKIPSMSWLILPYDEKIVFGPQQEDLWEICVSRAIQNKTTEFTNKYFKS